MTDYPKAKPAPPTEVTEMAAAWVAHLAVGDVSDEDLARLRVWLESDDHRRAFDRARQVWRIFPAIKDVAITPARRLSRSTTANLAIGAWRRHRRAAVAGGLAASLAGAILFAQIPAGDLHTAKGEVRQVRLADGTVAWLDADSALDLHYSASERRVELARGRVWFDVVHDLRRPFRVSALDGVATDVGTAFEVERTGGEARVGVSQGVVNVREGGQMRRLITGQSTTWGGSDNPTGQLARFDPDTALSWRSGRIVLDHRPLAEALDIVRRYRPGLIVLLDDRAAHAPVSGTLFTARLDQGLDTLASSEGLSVTRLPFLTLLHSDDRRFGRPGS